MNLFKQIFENNSSAQRDVFFKQRLIVLLWKIVMPHFTYDVCFGKKTAKQTEDITPTYAEVSRQMKLKYGLEMPAWWNQMFPSASQ